MDEIVQMSQEELQSLGWTISVTENGQDVSSDSTGAL